MIDAGNNKKIQPLRIIVVNDEPMKAIARR